MNILNNNNNNIYNLYKNDNSLANMNIINNPHTTTNNNVISFEKDKDNLNKDIYLIKMFGRFGGYVVYEIILILNQDVFVIDVKL